jgi:hypothetical protein
MRFMSRAELTRRDRGQHGQRVCVESRMGSGGSGISRLFSLYGNVEKAKVVLDEMGRPRGFAFVEMTDARAAEAAIAALNGTEMFGRTLVVEKGRASATQAATGARRR